jgi:hypothetical protein
MAESTVFANGLAIACKAVEGKSTAAFPDPCWTNPGPSAGPIVIPFANTAYAKDTANASKTVFIGGKPVMLKDKSYFKTSTGDEAAAYGKGLATGVKQGKAYFASWSMNIKIEGFNVCRHTDLMTHNHGSKPGNTAVWNYTDRSGGKPPKECFEECVAIEKACGQFKKGECKSCAAEARCGGKPDKTSKKQERDRKQPKLSGSKKKQLANSLKRLLKKEGIHLRFEKNWKMDACFPCGIFKPGLDPQKQIDCLTKQIRAIEDSIKKFEQKLFNTNITWDKLVAAAKLSDLSFWDLIGGQLKIVKNINRIVRVGERMEAGKALGQAMNNAFLFTTEALNNFKTIEKLFENYKTATPEEILATVEYCVESNACLKKRRCLLEPYKESKMPQTLFSKQGCCPGQTAHHLIPNSMFQEERRNNGSNVADCRKYRHDDAPNVCVEGVSQNIGSHKRIHDRTADKLEKFLEEPSKMTYKKAKRAALDAHYKTFSNGDCDRKCLETQLDDYFKRACGKSMNHAGLRRVNGRDSTQYDPDDYCPQEGNKP